MEEELLLGDLVEVSDLGTEREPEIGRDRKAEDDLSSRVLTEKMVILMQKISEYGYLSLPEIQLIYANQTYAYSVLAVLKDKGLVGHFDTTLLPKKAYYLKPKGYRTLQNYRKLTIKRRFLPQRFKPFIFSHRMACAKVGLILESHPLIPNFLPESLLWERRKRTTDKMCDGEFSFRFPDLNKFVRVGLEVELTLKNHDKLVDSFRDLKARRELDQVWWVCGNESLLKSLSRLIGELPWLPPQQHLFTTLDELLKSKHKTQLRDQTGVTYGIDPARPALPRPPEPEPPPLPKQEIFAPAPIQPWKPPVEVSNGGTYRTQAAAPRQPQPGSVEHYAPERYSGYSSDVSLWDWIGDCWEWIKGLWELEQYYDEENYVWRTRGRYKRWLLAAYLSFLFLWSGSLIILGKYPWLIDWTVAFVNTGELPSWRTRRMKVGEYYGDGWSIYPLSLRSLGDFYRFKVRLINRSGERELKRIAVYSMEKPIEYGSWELKPDVIGQNAFLEKELEFNAPASLRSFRLVLIYGFFNRDLLTDIKFR